MKTPRPLVISLCMLACLSCSAGNGGVAASPPDTAASRPTSTSEAPTLLLRIKQGIGEAGCDNDRQCLSVALGWKACGGPEAYAAVSTLGTDTAGLGQLVKQHRELRQRDLLASGEASNCMVPPNPGAVCRPRHPDGKRVCQLGNGGQSRVD